MVYICIYICIYTSIYMYIYIFLACCSCPPCCICCCSIISAKLICILHMYTGYIYMCMYICTYRYIPLCAYTYIPRLLELPPLLHLLLLHHQCEVDLYIAYVYRIYIYVTYIWTYKYIFLACWSCPPCCICCCSIISAKLAAWAACAAADWREMASICRWRFTRCLSSSSTTSVKKKRTKNSGLTRILYLCRVLFARATVLGLSFSVYMKH